MKNLIFCGLVSVLMLAACKKEKLKPYEPPVTTEVVFPSDSVSYTIDGKTYILNTAGGQTTGNTDADIKIDSIVNGNEYYRSGRKDSVFFYRTFDYFNASGSSHAQLSFFRKYSVNDMYSSIIKYPNDQSALFAPGNYIYGTDFTVQNATDGVGINVGWIGQTYNDKIVQPYTVTPASESNAHFRVLSFKQVSDKYPGQYVLEAKFDATLFDKDGNAKQLTDGYARINVAVGK